MTASALATQRLTELVRLALPPHTYACRDDRALCPCSQPETVAALSELRRLAPLWRREWHDLARTLLASDVERVGLTARGTGEVVALGATRLPRRIVDEEDEVFL